MPIHESVQTTASITSSQQVTTSGKAGLLYGYKITAGPTSQTVVKFRDGGASGTILWQDSIIAQSAAGDATPGMFFNFPISFTKDIYVGITGGTGAAVTIAYLQTT
jgi:hypothetical protein